MSKQTVGDVISEYRGYAFGLPANYRVTMTWGQFREILNHIETIWKREREALFADAAKNVNSASANDTRENNAAAMREALLRCDAIAQLPEVSNEKSIKDMRNIIRHALSAPHCDRIEAAKMREALEFAEKQLKEATEDTNYGEDIVYLVGCMRAVASVCSQALATEKEGGAE